MYLHNDMDLFREVIEATSVRMGISVPIVEKDYYVTMILKQLASKEHGCVFKGGTSLSKCYQVIQRFSEDIDITFSEHLTQGKRKKLKNETIAGISRELDLEIADWDAARSRRDFNKYTFSYEPLEKGGFKHLTSGVRMEVSLGTISYPSVNLPVDSLVYRFLLKSNADIIREFSLEPFEMSVQSLERTFIEKVFAICDYYLNDHIQRHSRHIYDICMLLPLIRQDEEFKNLIVSVRQDRSKMIICPSAKEGMNINELLDTIIRREVYKTDYRDIEYYFQAKPVSYETVISALNEIIRSDMFAESK